MEWRNFTTCSFHKTFLAFVTAFTHFVYISTSDIYYVLFPFWWATLKEVYDTYTNRKVAIFQ